MINKKLILILCVVLLVANISAVKEPSAVYCSELGYKFVIESTVAGDIGMCEFPDGVKVNARDFLDGKVGQEYSYCNQEGYELKIINDSEKCKSVFSKECAVCIKEGDEIEVTTLMNLSFIEGVCGDNLCALDEFYETCPEDCFCGDGVCDSERDEDPISCAEDCVIEELTPEEIAQIENPFVEKQRPYLFYTIIGIIIILIAVVGFLSYRRIKQVQ